VEFIRARRELRHALIISDPTPVDNVRTVWASAGQAAIIGIFLILFGAFLYVGRAILLPIMAAAIIALTMAPLVKSARRYGLPPWLTGLAIVAFSLGLLCVAASALAGPVTQWIARAPEIGAIIRERLAVLDQPLAALHQLKTSLFGEAGGGSVNTPDIVCDIERNLAGYLAVVTIINTVLGIIVAVGTWLIGYPNPVIFGVLAGLLNYVPYVGPGVMVVALFGVGLVSFPSIGHALIAPLGLIALTTLEGHFVTPTVVGRRLTLNPLLVLLALAFWTWMWGPFGAFLAVPLSIVGLVVFNHLVPPDDVKLPE